MKRILVLCAAALLLVMTLSACGGTTATGSVKTVTPPEDIATAAPGDDSPYDDDLDGLCLYLEANGAIIRGEGDAAFTEMSYKEIGAIGGYRYRFICGSSTVQAEFYEFDLENLDAKGKECIDSVREKGRFTVLEKEVAAQLHPSEKYLLIYNDTGSAEANELQRHWVETCFSQFKTGVRFS